jgi:sterol 3beta-glucosyltransferase
MNLGEWLATQQGQRLLQGGGARLFRAGGEQYRQHADEFDRTFIDATEGVEALVGGLITIDRVVAMGDYRKVPVAMLAQYPVAPTKHFPSVTMASRSLRFHALNEASGYFAYWLWRQNSEKPTKALRRRLGLSPMPPPFYRLRDSGSPILHTFSSQLLPRPADWPTNLKVTGGWRMPSLLRSGLGEILPGDLESWLDEGDPPIFLGFGSMPILDPQSMFDSIVQVTTSLGVRGIVSANCVPKDVVLPDHLRVVGAVDHDSLFPRCRAVVHHGGLGSTMASLRAGCPTMICSVFADQPWWGGQVQRLGVGAHIPFRKLSWATLSEGLRRALTPSTADRAKGLGDAIRAEGDGLPAAVELLDEWLAEGRALSLQPTL